MAYAGEAYFRSIITEIYFNVVYNMSILTNHNIIVI